MDEKELIEQVIREIKKRIEQDGILGAITQKAMVIGTLQEEEKKALKGAWQILPFRESGDWDLLIVAQLPIGLMAELALGIPGSKESACILDALLRGRKVYCLEEGMEYRRCREDSYQALYRLYQGYEDIIQKFGIKIIQKTADLTKETKTILKEEAADCMDLAPLRLLRESDLIKARNKGFVTVLLNRDAIITPLAKDYMARHNMLIKRAETE